MGWFLKTVEGKATIDASSPPVSTLIRGWIAGTLHVSKMAVQLDRALNTITIQQMEMQIKARDLARKMATLASVRQYLPESPLGRAMLEELVLEREGLAFDTRQYIEAIRPEPAPRIHLRTVPRPQLSTPREDYLEARGVRKIDTVERK